MSLLSLKNLKAGYFRDCPSVELESLSLSEREIHFLIGPNGAGKSTLLRTLSGSIKPLAGDIHASKLAFFPSQNTVQEGVTGYDVADILESRPDALSKISQLFAVEKLMRLPLQNLSSGEIQRVRLSCVLAIDADVFLLDEPLSFLEIRFQFTLRECLHNLQGERKAFVIALHDLNWMLSFQNSSVTALALGKVLAQGPVESVLTHSKVQETFGFQSRISSNELSGDKLLVLAPYEQKQQR